MFNKNYLNQLRDTELTYISYLSSFSKAMVRYKAKIF